MKYALYTLRPTSILAAVFVTYLLLAMPARAAGQPTAISIGAPTTTELGQQVTLQARLVNGAGQPIANAEVLFVSPATFLGTSNDVVVASAMTDKTGLATAAWEVRRNGSLTVKAEFRGNDQYASSQAAAQMVVTGNQQLYVQQAGVQIPGLNKAPISALAGFWPRLSGWPLAMVLLIVWSLYGVTVSLIFRIALAGRGSAGTTNVPAEGESR